MYLVEQKVTQISLNLKNQQNILQMVNYVLVWQIKKCHNFTLRKDLSLNLTLIDGSKTVEFYITLVQVKPCLRDKLPIIVVNNHTVIL